VALPGQWPNPKLVLEAIKPVGYFAFADARTVALFVLGKPMILQLADTQTGRSETVASNIGRPIFKIPGRHTISFLGQEPDGIWWIKEIDPATHKIKPIVTALEGSDYFAWTPQRILLMTKGHKLYQCNPARDTTWREVAAFTDTRLQRLSRIAVSPNGKQIALVAEEP
jgi:hypothetical protein